HIVANPYTLFYKADTYSHQERLKNIFPLVLGAIDKETLYLRQELKELEKDYSKKMRELGEIKKATEHWLYQIKNYFLQALEFGLILNPPESTAEWSTQSFIDYLKQVPRNMGNRLPQVEEDATNRAVTELQILYNEEIEISHEIGSQRHRLYKLSKLFESEKQYENSLKAQNDRLGPVNWLKKLVEPTNICAFCGAESERAFNELSKLAEYQVLISNSTNDIKKSYDMLDREIVKVRIKLNELEKSLNNIRTQREILEFHSEESRQLRQTENEIFRFVGRLEKSLEDYKLVHEDDSLNDEIIELEKRINKLKSRIDPQKIKTRLEMHLQNVSKGIATYTKFLGVEDSDDPISLDIKNLTIKKKSKHREDYLWEIGSGANWMGYHIATMLALHDHFIKLNWNPVPQFLIIDQPSQVYFPEKSELDYKSEDIQRVQQIFTALSQHIRLRNYATQIIVIEHADANTWVGSEEDVYLVERWRDGKALIPEDWIE
ncbi:DUF3732 domain-containing protein, partial [Paenibacillus sp. TAF43_2]|uniref:DUF3732 domain-containing protein n=1 Tax=Paenibacillus sp. TAF43_2 TaxID=3233069 RepID=UPI003F961045